MPSKSKKKQSSDFDEAQIAAWLKSQPDFFARYPDCLASMELPVDAGPAISLHQYQVRVLREEKSQLKQKLNVLVKNVRTNHKIHADLLELAGSMIQMAKAGSDLETYLSLIRKNFALLDAKLLEKDKDSEYFEKLNSIMGKRDSVCNNAPDKALLKGIFKAKENEILSISIVPVKQGKKCAAFLVLAADDVDRFKPGMGGEFLKLLAHLVSRFLYDDKL